MSCFQSFMNIKECEIFHVLKTNSIGQLFAEKHLRRFELSEKTLKLCLTFSFQNFEVASSIFAFYVPLILGDPGAVSWGERK